MPDDTSTLEDCIPARDVARAPREGDEIQLWDGRRLIVDRVTDGEVAYRLVDQAAGLIAARRTRRAEWSRAATKWSPYEPRRTR